MNLTPPQHRSRHLALRISRTSLQVLLATIFGLLSVGVVPAAGVVIETETESPAEETEGPEEVAEYTHARSDVRNVRNVSLFADSDRLSRNLSIMTRSLGASPVGHRLANGLAAPLRL